MSGHATTAGKRVRLKPAYFKDEREYELVVMSGPGNMVTVALFCDPDGVKDEVFGFVLTPQEVSASGRAFIEVSGITPSA